MNPIKGYYVNKVAKERLPTLKEILTKKETDYIKKHIQLSDHQIFIIESQSFEMKWLLYRIVSMIILNVLYFKTQGMIVSIPSNKNILELSGMLAIILGSEWTIESSFDVISPRKYAYLIQSGPKEFSLKYEQNNSELMSHGSLKQYDASHAKDLLDHIIGKRNDLHAWIDFMTTYTVFDDLTDIEALARTFKEDMIIWGDNFDIFYTLRKFIVLRKGLDIRKSP